MIKFFIIKMQAMKIVLITRFIMANLMKKINFRDLDTIMIEIKPNIVDNL